MTTPALAALRSTFPFARIDVAVGRWTRVVYEHYPQIDRLVDLGGMIGGQRPALSRFLGLARRIVDQKYDGAIIMERSLWFSLLPAVAGIPVRIGYDNGIRGMTHTISVDVSGVRHEVDRYLDLVIAAGARATGPDMVFSPSELATAEATNILAKHRLGDRPFALLHPGGGVNPGMRLVSKRWPVERFAEIAQRLTDVGVCPLAVWGPGEGDLGRTISNAGAISVGDVSLPVLGALASRAAVYLGNDSGPSHIASASGARTIVVFGPSDERRYGPYGARSDGTPVGQAVAEPMLSPRAVTGDWLERSTESVTAETVWNAIDRALRHTKS